MNIFGSSDNNMEIHCPSPFPRKLKTVDGPARLMSFPCNEFVPRRQLTRNNSEIVSTQVATVWPMTV